MQTVFDWVTIALFAGLIVLFLQRSVDPNADVPAKNDSLLHYLGASIGLAVANYLGNEGQALGAWALIAGVCVYIFVILKPFAAKR